MMIYWYPQVRKGRAIALQPTDKTEENGNDVAQRVLRGVGQAVGRPHSRSRLPSMSMPISGAVSGMSRMTTVATAIGKLIFSVLGSGQPAQPNSRAPFGSSADA